jgi:hypothetical protein
LAGELRHWLLADGAGEPSFCFSCHQLSSASRAATRSVKVSI